jgi:LPPG:FO 2-phospho-L-lactate transferase
MPPNDLTVIVNTGDDFRWLGLYICPDIDTIIYTLAGVENRETGWGLADDTFHVLDRLGRFGCSTWFRLGDRDLATHIFRTHLLQTDSSLSEATAQICRRNGIDATILPMTNSFVPTLVQTEGGILEFQDYFVRRRAEPPVRGFIFRDSEVSRPAPGALEDLEQADAIIICPSNPYISIGPILSVPGIEASLCRNRSKVVAISPIIGGRAVKGPAGRMLRQLGKEVSPVGVAELYRHFVGTFVLDNGDRMLSERISSLDMHPYTAQTLMDTTVSRIALAERILEISI